MRQGPDRFFHRIHDGTSQPIFDHFGHGATTEREHWRAASHGLDHRKAKRLRPVNRKQERVRLTEKLPLLLLIDLPDELDARAAEKRLMIGK